MTAYRKSGYRKRDVPKKRARPFFQLTGIPGIIMAFTSTLNAKIIASSNFTERFGAYVSPSMGFDIGGGQFTFPIAIRLTVMYMVSAI